MKLSSYLKEHNVSTAAFARKIGVYPLTVYRWCDGKRFPLRHLHEIEKATGGAVTANDFVRPRKEET